MTTALTNIQILAKIPSLGPKFDFSQTFLKQNILISIGKLLFLVKIKSFGNKMEICQKLVKIKMFCLKKV